MSRRTERLEKRKEHRWKGRNGVNRCAPLSKEARKNLLTERRLEKEALEKLEREQQLKQRSDYVAKNAGHKQRSKGNPASIPSCVLMGRVSPSKLQEIFRLGRHWAQFVLNHGWVQTPEGFQLDDLPPLGSLDAYVAQRRINRITRQFEEANMPDYLRSTGWTQSGPLGDVWSRPDWDKKTPGIAYFTLKKAYKVQKGIEWQVKENLQRSLESHFEECPGS